MSPKELAAHYNVKVFDKAEAAEADGYVVTQTMSPRNVWNKASAASAIIHDLLARKRRGEASEIAIVLEAWSVAGYYKN
jgi:hypothetical protein